MVFAVGMGKPGVKGDNGDTGERGEGGVAKGLLGMGVKGDVGGGSNSWVAPVRAILKSRGRRVMCEDGGSSRRPSGESR